MIAGPNCLDYKIDKKYVYICSGRNIKVYNHKLDYLFEYTNNVKFIGYEYHIKNKVVYTWRTIQDENICRQQKV